jgi:hypothetical protein
MTELPMMTGTRFLDPVEAPSQADEHYTPRHLRAMPLSPELQQALDEAFAAEREPDPVPRRVPAPPPGPEPVAAAHPQPERLWAPPTPPEPMTGIAFPDPVAYAARRIAGESPPVPAMTGHLFRRKVDPSRLIVPSPTDRQ